MLRSVALCFFLLVAPCQGKLNPVDFPLEAKVIDVKGGESGSVSKTTKGPFCDNVPADSPLCAQQKARTVTTTIHEYVLTVQIADKIYETVTPYLVQLGNYKANLHGNYLRLLTTNEKGSLRAYNLKIIGIHEVVQSK
jgi:hypothetical protein